MEPACSIEHEDLGKQSQDFSLLKYLNSAIDDIHFNNLNSMCALNNKFC